MRGRNVLCYGEKGQLLWRVRGCGLMAGSPPVEQAFFGIHLEEDGSIRGGTLYVDITIDPDTGELSNIRQGY